MSDHDAQRDELAGFLAWHRALMRQKADGLTGDQLRWSPVPSGTNIIGILKHLAYVEDWWTVVIMHNDEPPAPWDTVDWDADPDWDFHSAVDDSLDEVLALWDAAAARTDAAVAHRQLDDLSVGLRHGEHVTWRWLLIHLIEEYAQHLGHLDIIREMIDAQG